jgi:hypothetical protein
VAGREQLGGVDRELHVTRAGALVCAADLGRVRAVGIVLRSGWSRESMRCRLLMEIPPIRGDFQAAFNTRKSFENPSAFLLRSLEGE